MVNVRLTPEAFAKPPGGVRRIALELLSALRLSAGEVTVSVSSRVNGTTLTTPTPSAADRALMQLAESVYFARQRLSAETGVAHSLYYDQQKRLADWPLVVTVHDMIHERFGVGSPALRWAKRLAVRNAALVITPSRATAADLERLFPRLRAEVITIPWGVGEAFVQAPREAGSEDTRPFLLYVGGRNEYKNFGLLVHALANAPDLDDLRVVLVGGGALLEAERAALIEALGTSERLSHVTSASDATLRRLYDDAAALVVTSRCEGFGLPILEAMTRGCPVACATGGSAEEVAGGFASTFDPDSPAECATAIRAAVGVTGLHREAAAAHAGEYDWVRVAKAHIDAYAAVAR